ncbi:MAG: hypothetical protein WAK60_07870 [Sedimentisphaerales bacterium]
MKPTDDIHKLIKKLQIKASAELDRRVHDDISRALAESQEAEPAVTEPNIWRFITKGGITKLAVAATILITFGMGFSIGRWSKPSRLAPPLTVVSVHPTTPASEDSFWRRKVLAAMQSRPYAQTQITKVSLIDAYKQYLKGKHYD